MIGYWKDPAGTARVLRNGYYYTGDLGYVDEDGYIFITGRSNDIIKAGGKRVSAKEIEDVLAEIPGILECAAVGIPDEILGEAIKALVVPNGSGLSEKTVRDYLARRLPLYKLPKWIEFRDSFPKNESGKILKSKIVR